MVFFMLFSPGGRGGVLPADKDKMGQGPDEKIAGGLSVRNVGTGRRRSKKPAGAGIHPQITVS
jgi:hypothetical protein